MVLGLSREGERKEALEGSCFGLETQSSLAEEGLMVVGKIAFRSGRQGRRRDQIWFCFSSHDNDALSPVTEETIALGDKCTMGESESGEIKHQIAAGDMIWNYFKFRENTANDKECLFLVVNTVMLTYLRR